mmetsp:Transcript_18482/g.42132  ORF Transcript_18482/g.42132 Transcript_18482/m.42132 type:complete len:207 (+) Transcript_18482:2679-3299(+)
MQTIASCAFNLACISTMASSLSCLILLISMSFSCSSSTRASSSSFTSSCLSCAMLSRKQIRCSSAEICDSNPVRKALIVFSCVDIKVSTCLLCLFASDSRLSEHASAGNACSCSGCRSVCTHASFRRCSSTSDFVFAISAFIISMSLQMVASDLQTCSNCTDLCRSWNLLVSWSMNELAWLCLTIFNPLLNLSSMQMMSCCILSAI